MAIETRDPRESEARAMQFRRELSEQIASLRKSGVAAADIVQLIHPSAYENFVRVMEGPVKPSEHMLLSAIVDEIVRKGHFFHLPREAARSDGLITDTSASVDPLSMRPDDAGAGGKEFAFADTDRTERFMELLGSVP